MRWAAVFLLSIACYSTPSNAQEPQKQDEPPRLFRGKLFKRFEEYQDRVKKDRESRRKDQETERKKAVLERDERIRQLNERIERELRRAGLDGNFDLFGSARKKPDLAAPGKDSLPLRNDGLAPRKNSFVPSNPPSSINPNPQQTDLANGQVSLGVEARPTGITSSGVIVAKIIKTSPAAVAGFRVDDRITSVGGSPIKKLDDLRLIMSAFVPGDRTEVEIVRQGKKEKLLVEFPNANSSANSIAQNAPLQDTEELPNPIESGRRGNSPSSRSGREAGLPPVLPLLQGPEQSKPNGTNPILGNSRPNQNEKKFQAGIGVIAVAVDPILFERKGLSVRQGAYLEEIDKDSAASKAGLEPGDVIIALDGRKVDSAVGMAELVQTYQPGDKAQILFYRQNRLKRAEIQMDSLPISQQGQLTKPVREAENLTNRSSSSSSRRNKILSEFSQDFPGLKKVEQMIDRFGTKSSGSASEKPGLLTAPKGKLENQTPGILRENELKTEVQTLRSRLKSQDQQIQELTEKLSLIEKLIAEKQSATKRADQQK